MGATAANSTEPRAPHSWSGAARAGHARRAIEPGASVWVVDDSDGTVNPELLFRRGHVLRELVRESGPGDPFYEVKLGRDVDGFWTEELAHG